MLKYLPLILVTITFSLPVSAIYKDPGIAPDLCPVQNAGNMISEYFTSASGQSTLPNTTEPYSEGCHTLKVIYTNNLLSMLEINIGDNRTCSLVRPTECTVYNGKEKMLEHYQKFINYVKNTQKPDVRRNVTAREESIGQLMINQLQHAALERYKTDSQSAYLLPKVNQNLQALGVNLVLKGYEIDVEKTNTCMDYDFTCRMMMNDPASAPQRCKDILSAPRPAYCSQNIASNNQAPEAAAPVVSQLTEAQATEYLNLNLDVKKAFETKPASDTRTLIQFASQHYHERSEAEGRPRSVKEYTDCNPDVGLGFKDPSINTNTDEAKTNLVSYVAKHFQYLIQPKMPVSSRNFKTFGCMDLDRYLACYKDVRNHCTAYTNGKSYVLEEMKTCAFNHYRDNGKREGRDGTSNCQN